jgi:transposase
MMWLLVQGYSVAEVAELTGYSVVWVRKVVHRYNAYGEEGLRDQRHENPGRGPLLTNEQQQSLFQAMKGPAPGGGRWTSPKVADLLSQFVGYQVRKQRGWEYLQRFNSHPKEPAKKNSREQVLLKSAP